MLSNEKMEEILADIAYQYCAKYCREELPLVALNKNNLMRIGEMAYARSEKYADAPGAGIEVNIVFPVLMYVLSVVFKSIIADVYSMTKERIVDYICRMDEKTIERLFKENQRAMHVFDNLRESLCHESE